VRSSPVPSAMTDVPPSPGDRFSVLQYLWRDWVPTLAMLAAGQPGAREGARGRGAGASVVSNAQGQSSEARTEQLLRRRVGELYVFQENVDLPT
jgi:hypothetical protein